MKTLRVKAAETPIPPLATLAPNATPWGFVWDPPPQLKPAQFVSTDYPQFWPVPLDVPPQPPAGWVAPIPDILRPTKLLSDPQPQQPQMFSPPGLADAIANWSWRSEPSLPLTKPSRLTSTDLPQVWSPPTAIPPVPTWGWFHKPLAMLKPSRFASTDNPQVWNLPPAAPQVLTWGWSAVSPIDDSGPRSRLLREDARRVWGDSASQPILPLVPPPKGFTALVLDMLRPSRAVVLDNQLVYFASSVRPPWGWEFQWRLFDRPVKTQALEGFRSLTTPDQALVAQAWVQSVDLVSPRRFAFQENKLVSGAAALAGLAVPWGWQAIPSLFPSALDSVKRFVSIDQVQPLTAAALGVSAPWGWTTSAIDSPVTRRILAVDNAQALATAAAALARVNWGWQFQAGPLDSLKRFLPADQVQALFAGLRPALWGWTVLSPDLPRAVRALTQDNQSVSAQALARAPWGWSVISPDAALLARPSAHTRAVQTIYTAGLPGVPWGWQAVSVIGTTPLRKMLYDLNWQGTIPLSLGFSHGIPEHVFIAPFRGTTFEAQLRGLVFVVPVRGTNYPPAGT